MKTVAFYLLACLIGMPLAVFIDVLGFMALWLILHVSLIVTQLNPAGLNPEDGLIIGAVVAAFDQIYRKATLLIGPVNTDTSAMRVAMARRDL